MTDIEFNRGPTNGAKRERPETRREVSPSVEAPPPPIVVEPDPELTPEEKKRARKKYLLRRFWIRFLAKHNASIVNFLYILRAVIRFLFS